MAKILEEVTAYLDGLISQKGQEVFLADATLYLELFGNIAIAWQKLLQALAAREASDGSSRPADINFYQGKRYAARYFFAYELPKIKALVKRLADGDPLTVEVQNSYFND